MNKKKAYDFEAEICECCGQAKTYLLPIDFGTAMIVKAIAARIRIKGINIVHPTKEMEVPAKEWSIYRAFQDGVLTSSQIGNLTRARVHGLIARYESEPGNWVLTKKGAQFLRGQEIPRLAIIEKTRKAEGGRSHKQSYFEPEMYKCTFEQIMSQKKENPMWEGIDFDIVEGRIVVDLPVRTQSPLF